MHPILTFMSLMVITLIWISYFVIKFTKKSTYQELDGFRISVTLGITMIFGGIYLQTLFNSKFTTSIPNNDNKILITSNTYLLEDNKKNRESVQTILDTKNPALIANAPSIVPKNIAKTVRYTNDNKITIDGSNIKYGPSFVDIIENDNNLQLSINNFKINNIDIPKSKLEKLQKDMIFTSELKKDGFYSETYLYQIESIIITPVTIKYNLLPLTEIKEYDVTVTLTSESKEKLIKTYKTSKIKSIKDILNE